jgi:para-aminobenzoate synthetase component I
MQIKVINTTDSSLDLFERFYSDKPFCFFLDSGMDHGKLGRFSFMGAEPSLIVRSKGRLVEVIEKPSAISHQLLAKRFIGNPFVALKDLLKQYSDDFWHDEIPFLGGAVGYFGYDLGHFIEKLPSTAIDDIDVPDMCLGFYDNIIAVDHVKNKIYKINLDRLEKSQIPNPLPDYVVQAGKSQTNPNIQIPNYKFDIKSNFLKEAYIFAINRAKEYIRQGDIYQVNLSQRFTTDLTMPPLELYKRLREINPAPFAAYLDFGESKIISSSPERFLKVDAKNRSIETRPIKGTRPRGQTKPEDEGLKEELINSPKDRAEHIMIVDLERNDLGRVCEYGSVKPTEFIALEKYATVFHLVSTISGTLKNDVDAVDCLLNCFPGGSITGAPKIRSMEIIDELEPTKRSAYTGAIGYMGFNGNMDTNIVIRTFIAKGDKLYFQVGGGIVADSDPEAEYQETLDKAKALIEALGGAGLGESWVDLPESVADMREKC